MRLPCAVHLGDLLDMRVVQRLAEASFRANGMPIGILDALDGSVLLGVGWQEICLRFHRADARTARRCRESDAYIEGHLSAAPCDYQCKNGLRNIGIPIVVAGEHLATLFLGQFFCAGEAPDREFFLQQAREFGFDEASYLGALDEVPVFSRAAVENILQYDEALARFISDLAEGALRRNRAERELLEANRRKDEFLGVLSHELRNPLAPIRNALYILDHAEPAGQRARRAREIANRQLAHLTHLVDDLLDVTRIARGKIALRRADLDLAELTRRAGEDHRALMQDRGLELVTELPLGPVRIHGDETRLAQAIGNLLENAAKFTPAGGTVTLSVVAAVGAAEVRVRDTGSGIGPDLIDRLFEPFVQAKQSLARSEGGLGLGLALVRGIVELHGGSVAAASDGPGRGSEFTLRLPVPHVAGAPKDRAPGGDHGSRPQARGSPDRLLA